MLQNILAGVFFGNTIADYLRCVFLILAGSIAIKVFKFVLLKRLKAWARKTDTAIDDFLIGQIHRIGLPFLYLSLFFLSFNILAVDPGLKKAVDNAWLALLAICVVRFILALISYGLDIYLVKMGGQDALRRSLSGILVVSKVVIWGLVVVLFLDNLGFKISAVIAGLGIGGVAVALAAQAVLGDLFSYFAILFDHPFEVGDFIIIGDYLGTVEYIGIKTTRIRSLGGELVVFSNTDLTNSRVRNYKHMEKRRVLFKLGVTYQTSLEKLKIMPGVIQDIINNVKDTVFDRAHFFSYGDFCLTFEVVYYVIGADYNKYMDIQQEINFAIKKEFESRGIEFAYPTQTLFVAKE
jgi:small-conductance mechanosensitive channel